MTFNEANSVENYMKDLLVKAGWEFMTGKELPRAENDILVEAHVKEALINLNPEIKDNPELGKY